MSSHICPVVKLGPPLPIDKADKLVYFDIVGNGPVVVAKEDFKEGSLATFIPPESCVDTGMVQFCFLETHALDGGRCMLAGKVINPAYLEFRERPGMDVQVIL